MKSKKILICLLILLLPLSILSGCEKEKKDITSLKQIDQPGIKVGVQTGTTFDAAVRKNFPNAEPVYFNTYTDMATAILNGLIDCYILDEPVGRALSARIPEITVLDQYVSEEDYGFIFQKDSEKKVICDQLSEFITASWENGLIDELKDIWFGTDDSKKTVEMPSVDGAKTLKLAYLVTTDPMGYIKDGKPIGFELDIIAHFCNEYGYNLSVTTFTDFSQVIPAVSGGDCDIGSATITITEERKQSVYFTEPYYYGGSVVMAKASKHYYTTFEELNNKNVKIGIRTGTTFDKMTNELFPEAKLSYYDNDTDLVAALKSGRIDAYLIDKPVLRMIMNQEKEIGMLSQPVKTENLAFAFPKNEKGKRLSEDFSEFIVKLRDNGTLNQIVETWMSDDVENELTDYKSLEAKNGTLRLATNSTYQPFAFVRNGEVVGLDVELLIRFCREKGYAIDLEDMTFSAIIPSLISRCDIGAAGCSITDERKESVYFSEPYYESAVVVAVEVPTEEETKSFFETVSESFYKTFIKEERWKMIVSGIWKTVYISLLSALIGTILGFGICMLKRTGNSVAKGFTTVYIRILQGTPLVVLLMILFYLVFASSGISAEAVAVVGFAMNFGAYVSEMMRTGIESVDRGQTEAALALGYTKSQSFFRIVFPQAARQFLPVFRGEFISLVKMTSIVGYITVEDLTKVSDIIRSRTYDAFFPLIATAIIYFVISYLLSAVLSAIQKKVEPDRLNRKVKGVMMK